MPLEAKIDEKTASKTELNSVSIFYGFWLHLGGHLGGKRAPKWRPKWEEKMDAIFGGEKSTLPRGPAEVARPVGA